MRLIAVLALVLSACDPGQDEPESLIAGVVGPSAVYASTHGRRRAVFVSVSSGNPDAATDDAAADDAAADAGVADTFSGGYLGQQALGVEALGY